MLKSTEIIAKDLETGYGVSPYQLEPKRGPAPLSPLPWPRPNAGLSIMQATLGFVLGCILVLAVMGCFEFRRVALAAETHADAASFEVMELRGDIETLQAWTKDFNIRLGELQKAVGISQAAEEKARIPNVRNLSKTP